MRLREAMQLKVGDAVEFRSLIGKLHVGKIAALPSVGTDWQWVIDSPEYGYWIYRGHKEIQRVK